MSEVAVVLGVITLLVLANGLFVAAEFAIVGVSRASVEHLASEGSRLAQAVTRVLDDPTLQDRYIATTQIGVSVTSLGLGMYGEHATADWIAGWLQPLETTGWIATHTLASIIAVAMLTFVHIVIGEMVPKALALQRAERTVLYISPVVRAIQRVLLPLVVSLNALGNGLLRLAGVRRQQVETERYHTTEELQFIIRESQEGGLLRGESGRLLRELFAFGDLTAADVVVPRVQLTGIPVGTTAEALRAIVRSSPHTRYPVYDGDLDHIVGSLHIKDVLRHLVSGRPVLATDARAIPYVPEAAYLDELLAAMRRHQTQMAVVMDQYGGTAGLVTMEDLFQQVIGEIEDGRGRAPAVREAAGRLRVRGTVRLREVGELLGVTVEHAGVTTVSGLVLALLGRPPVVGDTVTTGRVRVEVLALAGRGVGEALVQLVEPVSTGVRS